MKTRFILLSLVSAAVSVSCTDNLSERLEWDSGIMAAIPGYEDEDATRVAFSNGFANFYWSNGDCIGVCRSSASANATTAYTLLKGGDRVGNFINDSFALLPQTDYFAFYPFAAGTTSSSFPLNMVTQTQNGNNSVSHIGPYNYMSAKFKTDDNSKSSFTFSNIGTVIQIHFTADKEDTYKNLYITSNGTPFIIRATYNLASETITPSYTDGTFRVSFGEEGMHVYNGETVLVTAVILPCDMSQSTLTFSVRNASGVAKEFSLAGFAFSKGKLYHFYEDDSKENPPYGGCPDGKHPHAIDLGLPSGNLWSCMDLGAEIPTEAGFEYSWGQTAFAQKNSSSWSNYEFMDDSFNSEWGITKYQVADNHLDGVWYNSSGTFIGDNKTTLEMQDDAARQNWGGLWRIPTREEMDEFSNYTAHVATYDYNGTGIQGYIWYKKKANGKYSLRDPHVFIRSRIGIDLSPRKAFQYWTSSLKDDSRYAYDYVLETGRDFYYSYSNNHEELRTSLNAIRPVQSGNGDSGSQSGGRQ